MTPPHPEALEAAAQEAAAKDKRSSTWTGDWTPPTYEERQRSVELGFIRGFKAGAAWQSSQPPVDPAPQTESILVPSASAEAREAWDIWTAEPHLFNAPNETIAKRITARVSAALARARAEALSEARQAAQAASTSAPIDRYESDGARGVRELMEKDERLAPASAAAPGDDSRVREVLELCRAGLHEAVQEMGCEGVHGERDCAITRALAALSAFEASSALTPEASDGT